MVEYVYDKFRKWTDFERGFFLGLCGIAGKLRFSGKLR